jgi:hypothetical protein
MQFTSRKSATESAIPCSERSVHVDLKFTQTGRYLIAAGSDRQQGHDFYCPVLYISVIGDKGWARHYPLEGKFARDEEAAAAALHYGIQIITRQVRTVPRPGDPLPIPAV